MVFLIWRQTGDLWKVVSTLAYVEQVMCGTPTPRTPTPPLPACTPAPLHPRYRPLSPSGYGLPDDIVIEKRGRGDTFVDCSGADVRISCMKFVQHDAVEGILGGSLSARVRWVRL